MGLHTATRRNKKVHVVLFSGERFIDRFVDRRKPFVIFKKRGKVNIADIRAMSDYRNPTGDQKDP